MWRSLVWTYERFLACCLVTLLGLPPPLFCAFCSQVIPIDVANCAGHEGPAAMS